MRRFGCALVLLTLAACSPQRGEGVHVEAPEERQARQEAEFRASTPVGHADVRTRLLGLGLQADEIVPSVDPDHGIPLWTLRMTPERLGQLDAGALSELQLASNYGLAFADLETEKAFARLSGEAAFLRDHARAVRELKRLGDWDRVPRKGQTEPMEPFARRIEKWCDYDPGTALEVIDMAWLNYTRHPVDSAVAEAEAGLASARFDCLRRVVYGTQLRRYFIGYRGEPPPPVY